MLTFKKTQEYFLNRMKYIESSLIKSSGKISREHQKLLVWKKKSRFKGKMAEKDVKLTISYINILSRKLDLVRI